MESARRDRRPTQGWLPVKKGIKAKRIHRIELWSAYIHNKSIDRILREPYVTVGLVGTKRHQFIKNYHKCRLWLMPSWWFVRYIQLMYKSTKQFYSIKTVYPRLDYLCDFFCVKNGSILLSGWMQIKRWFHKLYFS